MSTCAQTCRLQQHPAGSDDDLPPGLDFGAVRRPEPAQALLRQRVGRVQISALQVEPDHGAVGFDLVAKDIDQRLGYGSRVALQSAMRGT